MSIFRVVLLIILISVSLTGCKSSGVVTKDKSKQFMDERVGIKHYYNEEYEQAFKLLSQGALWGYKESQYFIAFMFLKGQHVEQSTVLGMAWLGVAMETGRKDWEAQYKEFYEMASPELRARIDIKKQEYISKFGLKAQDVSCHQVSSNLSAKPRVRCHKGSRVATLYELELVE